MMADVLLAAIAYDPLLRISLGPLEVSPHGIGVAVGVLVGARLVLPAAARRGIDADRFYDVLTWALFGALIGARVAYVVNHLGDYLDDPLGVLRVWEGGFSLLCGLAGAVVSGYPKMRKYHIAFWRYVDAAVPGIALGIAVGRIGDLVIADHLGKPTDFVLGYVCPEVETGSPCLAPVGQAVHQTALYDMVGAALVFALLVGLARRPRPAAFLTATFGLAYGLVRVVEGFFRLDVTHGTGLNGSQWTALAVAVAAAVALVARRHVPPEDLLPEDPVAPDAPGEDSEEEASEEVTEREPAGDARHEDESAHGEPAGDDVRPDPRTLR